MKIFEGLSNSKNMVFNVKKFLYVGVSLTLWRKGGKKRCEWNELQISWIYSDGQLSTVNKKTPTSTKSF